MSKENIPESPELKEKVMKKTEIEIEREKI